MKKYKVLTNIFKHFREGDILEFLHAPRRVYDSIDKQWYQKENATKIPDDYTLDAKLVETHPEYFQEIKETNAFLDKMNNIIHDELCKLPDSEKFKYTYVYRKDKGLISLFMKW